MVAEVVPKAQPPPKQLKGYVSPYPTQEDGHVMETLRFLDLMGKGVFQPQEVLGFYGNDKGYDPEKSVWVVPVPADATKVALFPLPVETGVVPPTNPA